METPYRMRLAGLIAAIASVTLIGWLVLGGFPGRVAPGALPVQSYDLARFQEGPEGWTVRTRIPGLAGAPWLDAAFPLNGLIDAGKGSIAHVASLNGGATAVVFSEGPTIAVFDSRMRPVWIEREPIVDHKPRRADFAIASAPAGGLAFVWVKGSVFLSDDSHESLFEWVMFDRAGGIAGRVEFRLPLMRASDLGLLWWPGHGLVVSAADYERIAVQLLSPEGQALWPSAAVVEAGNNGSTTASMSLDARDSLTVLWCRRVPVPGTGLQANRFLAQRLSPAGEVRWPEPIDVGEAPTFSMEQPRRNRLRRSAVGVTRAYLRKGGVGDVWGGSTEYLADIHEDGRVLIREVDEAPAPRSRRPIG